MNNIDEKTLSDMRFDYQGFTLESIIVELLCRVHELERKAKSVEVDENER
jgi:hypothetical protein